MSCRRPSTPTTPNRLSAREIVERYKSAIVRIEIDGRTHLRVGTGFILSPEGHIATNLHVIAGGGKIRVKLSNGTILRVHHVLAIDEKRDLAVIQVAAGTPLPTLPLGNSDLVSPGDTVVAIGNPLQLDFTVSDGLISSVRNAESGTILQISAPISPGSSGGPLFNSLGEVIGVATMIFSQGQNINFGVPANYLKPMLIGKKSQTIEEFTNRFSAPVPTNEVKREIPVHKTEILHDCTTEQLENVVALIQRTIELGATFYNNGDHESCYRVYRQTASHLGKSGNLCEGVKNAFNEGLRNTDTKDDFTQKAWALRDTFDGILHVLIRKSESDTAPTLR